MTRSRQDPAAKRARSGLAACRGLTLCAAGAGAHAPAQRARGRARCAVALARAWLITVCTGPCMAPGAEAPARAGAHACIQQTSPQSLRSVTGTDSFTFDEVAGEHCDQAHVFAGAHAVPVLPVGSTLHPAPCAEPAAACSLNPSTWLRLPASSSAGRSTVAPHCKSHKGTAQLATVADRALVRSCRRARGGQRHPGLPLMHLRVRPDGQRQDVHHARTQPGCRGLHAVRHQRGACHRRRSQELFAAPRRVLQLCASSCTARWLAQQAGRQAAGLHLAAPS